MKKILLLSLVSVFTLSSCVKDKIDNIITKTALELLQTQWNWDYNIDFNYVGASTIPDNNDTLTIAGDYINFKADNTADIRIGGQIDNVPYTLISDTQLMFDGDTFTINTLSANKLVFTYQERTTTPYFDNVNTLSR
jgi:hypothetical protein